MEDMSKPVAVIDMTGDEAVPPPKSPLIKDRAKARLKSLLSLRRRNNIETKSNYERSILCRLPAEIRANIWRFTLQGQAHTHFHVYDVIYTDCTYKDKEKEEKRKKKAEQPAPPRISLLLTCKAIYTEAVHLLWDEQQFDLTLFPGLARPKENLASVPQWGKVSDCGHLLRRMRHATIVIQPGKRPDAEQFSRRIQRFLAAMDQCKHLKVTRIKFNLHHRTTDVALAQTLMSCFADIQPAQYMLSGLPRDLTCRQACSDHFLTMLHGMYNGNASVTYVVKDKLVAEVAPQSSELRKNCEDRGHLGEEVLRLQTRRRSTRGEKLLIKVMGGSVLAVSAVTLPISAPLIYYFVRSRKKQKGEKVLF